MSIGVVYVALLGFGLAYAIVAGLLGWLSDLGGADVHVDAAGHLDAGHPHPLSGTIVATFVTGFGAGGVIGHYVLEWRPLASLGLGLATGLAVAAAAFAVLELIFKQTQAGSEFAIEGLAGREGYASTTIPADGIGEVSFVVKGQREQSPARSADGTAIPKGQLVVIDRVMGSVLHVRAKSSNQGR
jgi:hypothetical protein